MTTRAANVGICALQPGGYRRGMPASRPRSGLQASTRLALPLFGLWADAGVPAARVLEPLGLAENILRDPDARIPAELLNELWEATERITGDRLIGLKALVHTSPERIGVLAYVMRASATLGDSIAAGLRYQRILHEATRDTLEIEGNLAKIVLAARGGEVVPPVLVDYSLACFVMGGRLFSGRSGAPVEVRFNHPPPPDTRLHEKIFGCPLRYGAAENAVVFRRASLERPLPAADEGLRGVLEAHVHRLLAELPEVETFPQRVRELIAGQLQGGTPSVEHTAAQLHVSPRTLRRRLQDEGTTYQQLLDELRHHMALRYLAQPEILTTEVSFLLGFSEPKAFQRAFKRWTGTTPSGYRAKTAPSGGVRG